MVDKNGKVLLLDIGGFLIIFTLNLIYKLNQANFRWVFYEIAKEAKSD